MNEQESRGGYFGGGFLRGGVLQSYWCPVAVPALLDTEPLEGMRNKLPVVKFLSGGHVSCPGVGQLVLGPTQH